MSKMIFKKLSWDFDGEMIYVFEISDLQYAEKKNKLYAKTSFSNSFLMDFGIFSTMEEIKKSIRKHFYKNVKPDMRNDQIKIVFYSLDSKPKELCKFNEIVEKKAFFNLFSEKQPI